MSSKTPRTEAEAKFARTQKRASDALRAVNDAVAESKRVEENTARLRALRMARDAKDAADLATGKVVPAKAGKGKAAAAKAPVAKAAAAKAAAAKTIPAKKLSARNDG